jgi:RND family efflux transporter MFP subunit
LIAKAPVTPAQRTRPRARRRTLAGLFALIGVVICAAIVAGLLPRLRHQKTLLAAARSAEERPLAVKVAKVHAQNGNSELELPGDTQALIDSPIYARADGYLSKRLVDIGDRVKTGQVLAELDTPELDQQIQQARAALSQSQAALKQLQASVVQARANLRLAEVTLERWKKLAQSGVFSKQESDEKQSAFEVRQAELEAAQANLAAAQNVVEGSAANVRRLEELKSFDKIKAPFDGVITARNMDVGTLVTSGNSGPAREIFRVAKIDPLRIFVNVPQTNIAYIRPGQSANLSFDEFPGRVFPAKIDRSSTAVDVNSRTMLMVLMIPNPQGTLRPGMYAHVRFSVPRAASTLLIPGDTLVVRSDGPQVAVVGPDHRVRYQKIALGRDYGAQLEVTQGLQEGDELVVNPTDQIRDGVTVEIRERER